MQKYIKIYRGFPELWSQMYCHLFSVHSVYRNTCWYYRCVVLWCQYRLALLTYLRNTSSVVHRCCRLPGREMSGDEGPAGHWTVDARQLITSQRKHVHGAEPGRAQRVGVPSGRHQRRRPGQAQQEHRAAQSPPTRLWVNLTRRPLSIRFIFYYLPLFYIHLYSPRVVVTTEKYKEKYKRKEKLN